MPTYSRNGRISGRHDIRNSFLSNPSPYKVGLGFLVSLALFFGLFFGVNYPEIIRHGWPLTQCTVTSTDLKSYYCCQTECKSGCGGDASGAPSCSSLVNKIDTEYSPSECQKNSSACPSNLGDLTCDDGYRCCSECCSTCSSCSESCSGGGISSPTICTQSCTESTCDCSCCSSTSHESCTVTCPTCYSVLLGLSYIPYGTSGFRNVSFTQNFSKDHAKAEDFKNRYAVGTSHVCYYNRKNLDEVALDVSFTPWKWAVTALFGMVPLLGMILFTLFVFCCLPVAGKVKFIFYGKVKARRSKWTEKLKSTVK